MYTYIHADSKEKELNQRTPITISKVDSEIKMVPEENYKLYSVENRCRVIDFVGKHADLEKYSPGLGYGFYEFTKPEFISYDKQVILMDKVFAII